MDTFWAEVDPSDGKQFTYGRAGDVPVVGDWNRDGVVTVGVRRGRTWYVSNVLGGATSSSFPYGYSTDRPVVWR